ncbi:unnamed protein product [Bursaphelenchus okinawaensis]|uniref:Prominin-like protein n=1 Tax=Bursaphelenchus okinawaensis TaxID=465554 RepID=A0A811KGS2_9BILA|nr:unnamed protein product [Bursaphelenchus okinawaensis]CAG9104178.1 unnamed protein product [Bursaphelenchus okinawaensis]
MSKIKGISIFVILCIYCRTVEAVNGSLEYNTDQISRDGVNDPAMKYLYSFNDYVISLLSNRPFPQETLIDQDFMNLNVVKSVQNNQNRWLLHEQWWLGIAAVLVVGSLLYTIFYILYKCCVCCCGQKKEEVDGRWDDCKRTLLNLVFAFFVIISIFASVAVLLCSQYATLSVERFPSVITWFGDDLEMYKSYNNELADEIIENGWRDTKDEFKFYLHNTGRDVVNNLYDHVSNKIFFQLNKINSATMELRELSDDKAFGVMLEMLSKNGADYGLTSHQINTVNKLKLYLPRLEEMTQLKDLNKTLEATASNIQQKVDRYVNNIIQRIDEEDSTVQDVQLQIKKELDSLDFSEVHQLAHKLQKIFEDNKQYINIAWFAFLGVAAMLFFIALCFLFGVFYGMCGRRASYYNDDCCVRPTGGKFYGCGIFLAVLMFFVLSVVASVLMLVFANATDIVCDPWKHPESRPEMIDLADRVMYEKLINTRTNSGALSEVLGTKTNLKQLIKGCQNQTTFVQMIGLRDKYKNLSPFNDKIDEISKLGDSIRNFFESDFKLEVDLDVDETEKHLDQLRGFSEIDLTEFKSYPQIQQFLPLLERAESAIKKLSNLPTKGALVLAQNTLANKDEYGKNMNKVVVEATNKIKQIIEKYFNRLQDSLETRITSCEPISHIMGNMRMAVCDHTVDPINGIWMSLLLSVILFVPLIMMANSLTKLYNHAAPFTKYTVHEPHTEAAFTTDDYAMTMNPNKNYETRSNGYHDAYPPPYLNDQYRYRY